MWKKIYIQQGKDTVYHLFHVMKIRNVQVVDPKEINLCNDEVIFHCSDVEIKCLMWKVFNNKKYMIIGSTYQEGVCCTFDIGTVFQDLLNNHYDYP